MNKKIDQFKSKDLTCKINRARSQLYDIDMVQMKQQHTYLEGYLQKIYSRQKKVARRESIHLTDRATLNNS